MIHNFIGCLLAPNTAPTLSGFCLRLVTRKHSTIEE